MPRQTYLRFNHFAGKNLHLGVCGSVAAYKTLELLRAWKDVGIDITVTLTPGAGEFVTPMSCLSLGASKVYGPMMGLDDIFAHLEPGQKADAMLIMPATATTIARLAIGDASEMLAAQALAFDKPKVIAPAMHPRMWGNPATKANWRLLLERGFLPVNPGSGVMACGDSGEGRLADVRDIYLAALRALSAQDMAGQTLLVTIGPTREFWDGVRFVSNPSSGLMGAAIAAAAWVRGAKVKAVCGPGVPWLPTEVERVNVDSAVEMLAACEAVWADCTLGCFAAAVCDYRPAEQGSEKLKKESLGDALALALSRNPDIAASLGAKKTASQRSIVFAAETSDLKSNAMKKLASKNADMIVGNIVGAPGVGFESENNQVSLLDKTGGVLDLPVMSKADIAWRIWDVFLKL